MLERFASTFPSTSMKARLAMGGMCLATVAARVGLLRLLDPFGLWRLPQDEGLRNAALIYRAEPMATVCALVQGIQRSLQELKEAPPLRADMPLLVLSHPSADGVLKGFVMPGVEGGSPRTRHS